MKTKIILTALIICVYLSIISFWHVIKSPITGITTAAQLDDTFQSYIIARAVNQNFVENIFALIALILIALVWIFLTNKTKTINE